MSGVVAPGFRRRILIEPAPGCVRAELEDDWHRMTVALHHGGGVVTRVESEMARRPWTTCPGAMEQLRATFEGQPLAGFTRRGEKPSNCTHLHDLALFAAARADGTGATAYEVHVSDPLNGRTEARLSRDGREVLAWIFQGGRIVAPEALAGRTVGELGDWVASLDGPTAEAARILRWACILALGRGMDIPAGLSATAFPPGSCYTFQPERAASGQRLAGAHVDFSAPGREPLAERADAFS